MTIATVKDFEDLPAVLTVKQVQDILGISKPKAYELAHTEGFPVVKFGRAFRVPKAAFLRWIETHTGEHRAENVK